MSMTPVTRTIRHYLQKFLVNRRYMHSSMFFCNSLFGNHHPAVTGKDIHNSIRYLSDKQTEVENTKDTNNKQFQFMAETKQLLEIVTRSLYSDKQVFLRELISNCSDSLEKLRHLQVAGNDSIENPDTPLDIKISTIKNKQQIIIEDTGVGMNREELIEYLGTIAHSSSKAFVDELKKSPDTISASDNVIGKFGVGFYSTFMVSDFVEVYSKSWKPGSKCHHWSSRGLGMFEIKEVEESKEEHIRGTKVILHLKDNSRNFAKTTEVKSIITKYSNFVQFPIFLDGTIANMQTPLWSLDPKSVSDVKHAEFYKFLIGDHAKPLYVYHFKLDMPISLTGLFYVPSLLHLSHPNRYSDKFRVSLYSRRVLIQDEASQLLPHWLKFLVGVVDSDDVPLNLSREMLQENQLIKDMKRVLTSRLLRALKETAEKDKNIFRGVFETVCFLFMTFFKTVKF